MPSRSNLEDRNGNRTGARPRVGEADPATRRKILDQRLKEGQSSAPPARQKRQPATSTRSPDALKLDRAVRDVRYRGTRIDDEVDKQSR